MKNPELQWSSFLRSTFHLVLSAMGIKLMGLVVQYVIALTFTTVEFGKFSVAQSTAAIVAVVVSGGLRQLLLSDKQGDKVSVPCVAIISILSIICMVICIGSQCYFRRDTDTLMIICAYAVASCLDGFSVVPAACLQRDLRFRIVANIGVASILMQTVLACLLIWSGAGLYGMGIARLLAASLQLILLLNFSRRALHFRSSGAEIAALLKLNLPLMLSLIGFSMAGQAPIFIAAVVGGLSAAGKIGFSITFCSQAVALVIGQMESLLISTNARQATGENQVAFTRRAQHFLAHIVVPLCSFQMVAAADLLWLFFGAKWLDVAQDVQYLTFGAMFFAIAIPSGALLLAQRRLSIYLLTAIASLLIVSTLSLLYVANLLPISIVVVIWQVLMTIVTTLAVFGCASSVITLFGSIIAAAGRAAIPVVGYLLTTWLYQRIEPDQHRASILVSTLVFSLLSLAVFRQTWLHGLARKGKDAEYAY